MNRHRTRARPTAWCWLCGALSLVLLVLIALAPAAAQSRDSDEQLTLKVKAALLYNVIKFVSWPAARLPSADSPIRICTLEQSADPFTDILDETVRGKFIDGHPLISYHSNRAADLRDCHLVYAADTDESHLRAALAILAGTPTLVAYEYQETLSDGVVRLLIVDNRLRFEINMAAAERRQLQLSSKLLNLSIVVRR